MTWARPPAWLDPERRLTRNTYHEHLDRTTRLGAQLRLDLKPPDDRPSPASPDPAPDPPPDDPDPNGRP